MNSINLIQSSVGGEVIWELDNYWKAKTKREIQYEQEEKTI